MFNIRKSMVIVLSLILILGILSGCSKPECKRDADCPSDKCTTSLCSNKKCVTNTKANCCGNGQCEKTETKCGCAEDCQSCPADTEYLKYVCEGTEQCISKIDETKARVDTKKIKILASAGSPGPEMNAEFTYPTPFNIDSSTLDMKLTLNDVPSNVNNIKISKIELIERVDGQVKAITEKQINKYLFDASSIIMEKLPLDIEVTQQINKSLSMRITLSYVTNLEETQVKQEGTGETDLPFALIIVNPSAKPSCPPASEWDDGNSCTIEKCDESTKFFVTHTTTAAACCGNSICDASEDSCRCPADCGQCNRNFKQYLKYSCVSNKCVTSLRSSNIVKPFTRVDNLPVLGVLLAMTTSYDTPFNYKVSKFNLKIDVTEIQPTTFSIECNKMQLLNSGGELLGEKPITLNFQAAGNSFQDFITPTFAMRDFEEDKEGVSIKLICFAMTNRTSTLTKETTSIDSGIGRVTFVNPES